MRDPKRIDETLTLLSQIWKQNPDLRFQQLVYILQGGYSENNSNIGRVESVEKEGFKQIGYDLFNTEDDVFMEHLREITKNGF